MLSKLPDDILFHMITIRRLTELDNFTKQCYLCDRRECNLYSFAQDLASKQQRLPTRVDSDSDRAASSNTMAVLHQTTSKEWPCASTCAQTISHNPSVIVLPSVDDSASSPQVPPCDTFWLAEHPKVQFQDIGPQLQLAPPRRVSDRAQSIAFAMAGNIDGLKSLFSSGLASPRDESHTRCYSLLRVSLSSL